jgi:hypothetical protein
MLGRSSTSWKGSAVLDLGMMINRRSVLQLTVAGAGVVVAGRYVAVPVAAAPPPLEQKDTYTVGFAQVGNDSPRAPGRIQEYAG